MVVTGNISNVQYPGKAAAGSAVKVTFHVTINNTTWGAPTDNYQFLIDTDTLTALKGNYISGIGDYERNEDINITMPDKEVLNFFMELWTEVPAKYSGVPVEGAT